MGSEIEMEKLRPKPDWLTVLADPKSTNRQTPGGVLLPDYEVVSERLSQTTGTIVRVGTGKKITAEKLETGMRVAFRRYLQDVHPITTGERWEHGEEKAYFMVAIDDVLGVIPEGMRVGVFSGTKRKEG